MKPSTPHYIGALLLSAGLSSLSAATGIISGDLGNNTFLSSGQTAGVVAAANWNNPAGTPAFTNVALNFSDATASGVTITAAGLSANVDSRVAVASGDANTTMFTRGVGIQSGGGSTFTFSNIPTTGDWADGYALYVYFAPSGSDSNADRTIRATVGATTYYGKLNTAVSNYSGAFAPVTSVTSGLGTVGANYFVFTGLSGDSISLTMMGNQGGAILATGFQLVANPIPEPGSAALLAGLAIVPAALLRRRRRAAV